MRGWWRNRWSRALALLALALLCGTAQAWKMEAGTVTLSATSGLNELETHTFQQIYSTPPIVIALTDEQGSDPSAVRISNVSTTSFRMSPVEPISRDGPHASMTVSYIAIEPGTHTFPDGETIEAGFISTSEIQFNGNPPGRLGWERLDFSNTFSAPIVLADIQTIANESRTIPRQTSHPFLTVAIRNISNTRADIALERSEVYDRQTGGNFQFDALARDETIGYVAMSRGLVGSFRANGNLPVSFETLFAGSSVDGWSDGCDSLSFAGTYNSAPIVVASKASRNEEDGGWLRVCDVNSSRIQLTVDEDDHQDRERNHAREDVSVLVFSDVFFYDSEATVATTSDTLLMEADSLSLSPGVFRSVSFRQVYETPPAVFVLGDDNNPEPSALRIRNVTESGFEVVPVEPDSRVSDATDLSTEMHYLAISKGQFQLPGGSDVEVGPLFPPDAIGNYQAKSIGGSSWLNFAFATGFGSTPALLTQIQTMNNEPAHLPGAPSRPWMTMAVDDIDSVGGQLALDRAETSTGSLSAAEQFSFLAVDPGTVDSFRSVSGETITAEAQLTPSSIRGTTACYDYSFLQSYPAPPLVIGGQMSRNGGDGGWLRRCAVSDSDVSLKIEEDWASDTDRSHTNERAGFMAFSQPFHADFSLVANYQLEGPVWNGTAGEVIDSSGSNAHGRRAGDASPVPARVCYGASLDGSGDHIEVPDNPVLDISEELTVMAWINASRLPSSDLMTIVSKDTNYEFHVDPSGRIFWWWTPSSGGARSFDTGSFRITTGTWHHVAIVYSRSRASQKIYVDGVERGSTTYANQSLSNNNLPFFIGTDYNFPSRSFAGQIDEVKVFSRALSAAAVQKYASETRSCTSCPLEGFDIAQPTYALACPDTLAPVTVTARCVGGAVKTDFVGTVDLSGPGGSVFFDAASGGNAITSLTFETADSGANNAWLYFNNENINVRVSAQDRATSILSSATSGTDFRATGFRVTREPSSFACGGSTSVTISAYGQTDAAAGGACEVLTGFSGDKDLDAWFQATLNDDLVADAVSSALRVNGTDITSRSGSANNNLSLNFSNGESSFTIAYPNAAKILELNLRHDEAPYDGSEFSELVTSTSAFVVRPESFVLAAGNGAVNLNGSSAGAAAIQPAGAQFELSATAVCSDGNPATDYNPIAGSNTILAYLQRTGPLGGSSVDGEMQIAAGKTLRSRPSAAVSWESAEISPGAFVNGQYRYAGATYSEVGLTRLHLKDQNYFGEETGASSANIGRFVPEHFNVLVTSGSFAPYCSPATLPAFTYTGQDFVYDIVPSAVIQARNLNNQITQNYTEPGYQKLVTSDVVRLFPSEDSAALGRDGVTPLALTLSSSVPAGFTSVANGSLYYQFAATDSYAFTRPANAQVAPFTADIDIRITAVTDSDGVSANAAPYEVDPTGIEIRYGRWNLESAYGPETRPLNIPMRVEYWDGNGFTTNLSDSCTTFDATALALTPDLSGGTTAAGGGGTLVAGEPLGAERLFLSAPGSGNVGTVDLEYQGDLWLQYDWDNDPATADTHATSTATFGQYRGHDRVIYWRELRR